MQSGQPEADPLLPLHTFAISGRPYAVEGSTATVFELTSDLSRALTSLRAESQAGRRPSDLRSLAGISADALAALDELRTKVSRCAAGAERLRWGDADAALPSYIELCLCATFRCNLACKYCFARLGPRSAPTPPGPDMTLETAEAAVDFALDRLEDPARGLIVSFGHTGEPLLMRKLYEQLRESVRARAAETGRRIAYGMAATNLTASPDDPLPAMSWPAISLDGPREIHDRVRVTPSGTGTHELVAANLRRLLAGSPAEAAETNLTATITAYSTDIKAIFLHLASFGAPFVALYPARLPPESDLAITPDAAQELLSGYDHLVDHLLSLDADLLEAHLMRMVQRQDYFGRHVLRVGLNHRLRRRCDAGVGMYAVVPNGDVFPCPELAALGVMRMGSIRDGLDDSVVQQLRSRTCSDLSACAVCWARLLCGGDCLSNRAMYAPYGTPPDPGMCALTRGLIERAVDLVTQLRRRHAEMFSGLLAARGPRREA